MEFLRELLFGIVDVAIAGAMVYYWRRSRIPALLILAAGLVLLALPVAIAVSPSGWFIQSEGSPAATIWFVLVLSLAGVAAIAGTSFAMTGMMRLLRGIDSVVLRFVASLGLVALLLFIGFSGYRAWKAPRQKTPEAPRVENTEPHRGGKAGARQAAERQRYDECVAYMRESYRRETLKACADGLVAAWDASHAAKVRFANMPDDGAFAASIGALYASYAEATNDRQGALEGIQAVRERTQARFPGDRAALDRLDGLLADLAPR